MGEIKELGEFAGPLLVFGGVYSNLHALEAMYAEAQRLGIPPQRIFCTGDVAAYCAFPDACLQRVADWGIHVILGNVEENLRDGLQDCGCGFGEDSRCDLFSRMWYPYAYANTSQASLAYIRQLPAKLRFTFGGQRVVVLHGSFEETAAFVWRSTDWATKAANLAAAQADVIIGGHCGLPFLHQQGAQSWINAGVIGMPANDGTPRVWYALLTATERGIATRFEPLHYDYLAARAAMLEKPLPKSYALTLKTGIWDNTEIMPPLEAAAEGIPLEATALAAGLLPGESQSVAEAPDPALTPNNAFAPASEAIANKDITPPPALQKTASDLLQQSIQTKNNKPMQKAETAYYDPKDLKRFGQISAYQPEMAKQFFEWYEHATHGDTALTQREKSLIALAVSHAIQCPYCVDAYTTGSLESGADEEQMMEAVHVAAAVKAGSTLIYGVQMKRQIEKLSM